MKNISEDQQNFPKDQNINDDDQKIDLEDCQEIIDDDLKQVAEDQNILVEDVESLDRISENIEIKTKCIFLIAHQESFFITSISVFVKKLSFYHKSQFSNTYISRTR